MGAIEQDTLLLPYVVADAVVAEAQAYIKADLSGHRDYLAERAERIYAVNAAFRRMLRKDADRALAHLYAFMRHWLAGKLKEEAPAYFARLPVPFSNGVN